MSCLTVGNHTSVSQNCNAKKKKANKKKKIEEAKDKKKAPIKENYVNLQSPLERPGYLRQRRAGNTTVTLLGARRGLAATPSALCPQILHDEGTPAAADQPRDSQALQNRSP